MDGKKDPLADNDDWFRQFVELTYQPAFDQLGLLLRVQFPPDLRLLFEMSAESFNARPSSWYPALIARGRDRKAAFETLHTDVQEGLRSTYYHLQNFLRIEDDVRRLSGQLHRMAPKSGASLNMPAASLNSEWESFTFLSRATLDRVAVFIRQGLETKSHHNLLEIRRWLERNRSTAPETIAYTKCLARHDDYLYTQVSTDKGRHMTERDRIAHIGNVPFANLSLLWQQDGTLAVWTSSDMSAGHDAGRLLSAQFYSLADLVIDLVVTFVGLDSYWARTPRPQPR